MKKTLSGVIALSGGLLFLAHPAQGADVEFVGQACWTGTIEALATSAKDAGYSWSNTGTFVNEADKAHNLYYRCAGIGGVVGGKPQEFSWWCLGHASDASTLLWRGSNNEDSSSTESYVSGTGRYEGVSGTFEGSALTPAFKTPAGKLAACRTVSGTMVLK